jgi:hypothetical protein
MAKDDRWTMFKNYMHNELGISKDDIRLWVRESCDEIAERMVKEEFGKFDLEATVNKLVENKKYWGKTEVVKEVIDEVSRQLVAQVKLTLK